MTDPLAVMFQVTGQRPIRRILVDLVGDGMPGWAFDFTSNTEADTDGRRIPGVFVTPWVAGTFNLVVQAWDSEGCTDRTAATRSVTVRR